MNLSAYLRNLLSQLRQPERKTPRSLPRLEALEDRLVCDVAWHGIGPRMPATETMKAVTQDASAPILNFAAVQSGGTLKIGNKALVETNGNYLNYIRFLTVPPENRKVKAFIEGKDVAAIKALETDPLRREIFDAMNNNPRTMFRFATLQHAKEEFFRRIATIQFMQLVEQRFDDNQGSNYDPARDYVVFDPAHPYVDPTFWQRDTHAPDPWIFETKPGVTNSHKAIRSLLDPTHTYRGDCLGGIMAAILHGVDRAIGGDRFNKMHPKGLHGVGWANNDPSRVSVFRHILDYLYEARDGVITVEDMVPGDWVYMKNKNDYGTDLAPGKKPGFWQGENVIYMGKYTTNASNDIQYDPEAEARFSGLGIYSATEDELRVELKKFYNEDMNPPNTIHYHDEPQDSDIRFERIIRAGTGSKENGKPAQMLIPF